MEHTRIGDLLLEHFIPVEKKHTTPLLYIPRMYGWAGQFRNWAKASAQAGWEVWVLNLRGHHGSRPVKNFGKVSLMDYAEDVEDVLRHIGPALLVGHSMGGLIAQIVADRNPTLPGIILLNSAASKGSFPGTWRTMVRFLKPRYIIANILHTSLYPHRGDILNLVFNNIPSKAFNYKTPSDLTFTSNQKQLTR